MSSVRKRRLQRKTDYKARLALLKSPLPRLVIRKTNRYVIAQIVSSEIAQDKVLVGKSTRDLLSNGWPEDKKGSLKSLKAAYELGKLIANEVKDKKIEQTILDIGMHRNIHKSRIYAVVKGAVDSGLNVKVDPEVLPSMSEGKESKEKEQKIEEEQK